MLYIFIQSRATLYFLYRFTHEDHARSYNFTTIELNSDLGKSRRPSSLEEKLSLNTIRDRGFRESYLGGTPSVSQDGDLPARLGEAFPLLGPSSTIPGVSREGGVTVILDSVTPGRGMTVTLDGLTPHSEYAVLVKAFNAKGAGPPSTAITATTLEDSEYLQLDDSKYPSLEESDYPPVEREWGPSHWRRVSFLTHIRG